MSPIHDASADFGPSAQLVWARGAGNVEIFDLYTIKIFRWIPPQYAGVENSPAPCRVGGQI